MAIQLQVSAINEQAFGEALGRLQDAVRRGLVDPEFGTLSKQALLLTEHCMKLTPPKTVGQGKRRLAADVALLFNPINPDTIRNDSLRKLVKRGRMEEWNKIQEKAVVGQFAGKKAVVPSMELHAPHKLDLLRRYRGGGRPLPKWVTLFKQRRNLRAVIKRLQERVGWARAGWLRGIYGLRGGGVSEWIARHGAVRGIFIDERNNLQNPYIEVRNNTNWGRHGESDRIVESALKARTRAMQSYFNAMMRLSAKGIATPWQALQAQINAQFFGGSNGGG